MSMPGQSTSSVSTSSLTTLELAEKFKLENPEQFLILVKMHLSFELDLATTEEIAPEKEPKKLFKVFSRKGKVGPKDGDMYTSTNIYQLMHHLADEKNLCQEGIFRRTGSLVRQQELKNLIYSNTPMDHSHLEPYSVHDCASVLKGYLADLPEPLLTDAHYTAHLQIAEICKCVRTCTTGATKTRLLHALQLLTLLLPEDNKALLKELLLLLHKTAAFEAANKMSADSLATLFTPHMLCPKKLSPEDLHKTSQNMMCTISFMISNEEVMTEVPFKLISDIRAFNAEYSKLKLMSPKGAVSTAPLMDNSEAYTIYTFLDVKKTNEAHNVNPTESALAELYAYIQELPDSSKKKKLIKQFNKQNGQGTPFQILKQKHLSNLGDSIKRHLFQNGLLNINKTPKRATPNILKLHNDILHSPKVSFGKLPKTRLFQDYQNSSLDKSFSSKDNFKILDTTEPLLCSRHMEQNLYDSSKLDTSMQMDDIPLSLNNSLYKNNLRYLSEPNLNNIGDLSECKTNKFSKLTLRETSLLSRKLSRGTSTGTLKSNACRTPDLLTATDTKFNSLTDFDHEVLPENTNLKLQSIYDSHVNTPKSRIHYCTSTPSESLARKVLIESASEAMEVNSNDRKSISPITKSTQGMSRAMQESIMTPRSRKPVIMLSGTNLCNFTTEHKLGNKSSISSLAEKDEDQVSHTYQENSNFTRVHNLYRQSTDMKHASKSEGDLPECLANDENCVACSIESAKSEVSGGEDNNSNDSSSGNSSLLSRTFREYLFSKSMLTASPMDTSFSSRPDDFDSDTSIINLSENKLSGSLLFCLNGNEPQSITDSPEIDYNATKDNQTTARKRPAKTELKRSDSMELVNNKQIILESPSPDKDIYETSL